ncbi:MAG: hypothetical protein J6K94_07115, partial [Ruminiclostridium sp.]|nr:hypothetical protein [Ruminiclostridium sp.]
MKRCDACGKSAILSDMIGKITLCKTCSMKIQYPFWKGKLFSDSNELWTHQDKVISLAQKNKFSLFSIEGLLDFFDVENKGYVAGIKGGRGQNLKLYETYCIIDTTSNFSVDEISEDYAAIQRGLHPEEKFLNKNADAIIKGVLSGRLLQTGMKIATAATADAIKNEYFPGKMGFSVNFGERKIWYSECEGVELIDPGVACSGYIRFILKSGRRDDGLFFFGGPSSFDYERSRKRVKPIYAILQNSI